FPARRLPQEALPPERLPQEAAAAVAVARAVEAPARERLMEMPVDHRRAAVADRHAGPRTPRAPAASTMRILFSSQRTAKCRSARLAEKMPKAPAGVRSIRRWEPARCTFRISQRCSAT